MKSLLKSMLIPGSPMLLLLGVIGGAILLLVVRTRTLGRRWLVTLGVSYWLMSTPVIADRLAAAIAAGTEPVDQSVLAAAAAIVVLDGGTARYVRGDLALDVVLEPTALRALEAARLYHAMKSPLVIVTGGTYGASAGSREGHSLIAALVRSGVPEDRIVADADSPDTRAHAVNVGRILRDRGISRFVLVTSATHMRRSLLTFRQEGLDPTPSAAAMYSDNSTPRSWQRWLPTTDALSVSEQTCYDAIGLTYYWVRGWV